MELDKDFLTTANEQGYPHSSEESDDEECSYTSSDNAIEREEPNINRQGLPHEDTDKGLSHDVTDESAAIPLATNRNEESHPLTQTRLSDVNHLFTCYCSSTSFTFISSYMYRIMTGDSMLVQRTTHCYTRTHCSMLTPHTLPSSLVTMATVPAMSWILALSQKAWYVTINSHNHDFI